MPVTAMVIGIEGTRSISSPLRTAVFWGAIRTMEGVNMELRARFVSTHKLDSFVPFDFRVKHLWVVRHLNT